MTKKLRIHKTIQRTQAPDSKNQLIAKTLPKPKPLSPSPNTPSTYKRDHSNPITRVTTHDHKQDQNIIPKHPNLSDNIFTPIIHQQYTKPPSSLSIGNLTYIPPTIPIPPSPSKLQNKSSAYSKPLFIHIPLLNPSFSPTLTRFLFTY